MFCANCGKEIRSNLEFCTFCGAKVEKQGSIGSTNNEVVKMDTPKKVPEIVWVAIVALIVLALGYVYIALDCREGNEDAFDWCSKSNAELGMILHFGICAVVCVECALIADKMRKTLDGNLMSVVGIVYIFQGGFLAMLSSVFDDWTSKDMDIIMYRIFYGTYGDLAPFTIMVGVVVLVCGLSWNRSRMKQ